MLVSVIVPCYNVEEYISECIHSIIIQSYKNIEIICIDNNSSDNTWQLLQELKVKHPQLIIDRELIPGAPAARNKGLNLAKGEWIQFLDADDLLMNTKIHHQIHLIAESNVDAAFVAAAYIKRSIAGTEKTIRISEHDHFLGVFINECGITSSNLWNKNAVLNIGSWNEEIRSSQETELMFRLILNNNKSIYDNEPLTIIRDRESGQISQSNPEKKWSQYIMVRLNFLDKLKTQFNNKYKLHSGVYFDFLMVSILTFAKYNEATALNLYSEKVASEWKSAGTFGFSKLKVFLIKTIGLKNFMKLIR